MPRIPKSTTCTFSGRVRSASRFTTSTPKPSSPRKTFPMPATRIVPLTGTLPGRRAAVRSRRSRRRNGAPAADPGPDPVPDRPPPSRRSGCCSQSPAEWIRRRPISRPAPDRRCPRPAGDEGARGCPRRSLRRPPRRPEAEAGPVPRRSSFVLLSQRLEAADGPVKSRDLFRCEGLRSLQDLAAARVALAHLLLLLVGQSHHTQDEQLVDLRCIEEIPVALWRDLGVVVQDDG